MLKQILAKIPRKVSKTNSTDTAASDFGNNLFNLGNGIQFNNRIKVMSAQLDAVKRMSSAIFPSTNAGMEMLDPHLSFKDVSNSEKQNLFVSKLNLCCIVYDFNYSDENCAERDFKSQALLELVDFIASGSAKFTEPAIASVTKMCATNLFREFPPKSRSYSTHGETEDDEPVFEPAWSHLQLAYDLLLQFINCTSLDVKLAKKYIDHFFISKLLNLFESEDPRERDCLKTILHRVYGKFMVHRPFIRKSVSNIIYRFVFETERHNGIAELLEIFGSVITGFAIPLKEEHKMFLVRALIPLHKPKSVGIYHQQLTYCVVQFVEKEPRLANVVIKGLLKFWPVTSTQKELMFLSELEEILENTSMMEFEKIMVPLFRRISCCLNSSHFQVAERAHLLWNNDHILNLIMNKRDTVLPLIFSALERNIHNHWNQSVLNLTQNIKKMFIEVDEELALFCQDKFEEEKSKSTEAAERRRMRWDHLENNLPAACVVTC